MPHSTQKAIDQEIGTQLRERIVELERANVSFEAGRRAALNLMEDAVLAKQQVDGLNRQLKLEIAERERAETELRESEARLRLVQAAGGIGGFDYDLKTDSSICSPEYYSMFGLPEGSPVNRRTWPKVIHPDDRVRVAEPFQKA